jgi:hypothetical protein
MPSRAWALCLVSLPLLWPAPARAQDDDARAAKPTDKSAASPKDDDEASPSDKKPTEGTQGEAHESLVPPKAAEAEEPPPVGPVERLPPTAYPEWKTRGIRGGSLWLSNNMHGMPWPYYPKTGIGVSGYVWTDMGYLSIKYGSPSETALKQLQTQERGLLRLTPTYTEGSLYVQGQSELVANGDQTASRPFIPDIDDLWLRAGEWKKWDVQLGRFEAFEVYHFGMGMDLNTQERKGAADTIRTPPDVFELGGNSNIVYRQDSLTNFALHAYPLDVLRLELLGQFGYGSRTTLDAVGVRPAAVLDFGWVKLKAAADLRHEFTYSSTSKQSRTIHGGTAALQFVLDPYLEFGANVAFGKINAYTPTNSTDPNAAMGDPDTPGSVTDLDTGGFANVRVVDGFLLGGGVNYNQETDEQAGVFTHVQTFGAAQYVFLKQLYIKLVGAYAKAHLAPGGSTPWDDTMTSVRLRVMFLF